MPEIIVPTAAQAQRLHQLMRIENRFNYIEQRLPLEKHDDGKRVSKTSEGETHFTISPHLGFAFWQMRQGLIDDLCKEGLGETALKMLTNRLAIVK